MTDKKELAKAVDETMLPTMTADGVVAQRALIKEIIHKVMKKDIHYGIIPGCEKPSLLKPGAEVLCLTFRLSPIFESREIMDGQHMTVFSKCTLTHIQSGRTFGSGEAICSTKEKKYARRKENGRYVDNQNLPDSWNTVLKMSNKRSLVASVLVATAASDEFTQDMGGDDEPLVVVDADAIVKDQPKEADPKAETVKREKKPKADDVLSWTWKLVKVDSLELDGGVKAFSVKAEDGKEFKTTDKTFASFAEGLIREGRRAIVAYKPNRKGSLVVRSFM